MQERSRVLDLLCHSLASIEFYSSKSAEERKNREAQACPPEKEIVHPATPVNADALAAYTPECDITLCDAADARARCAFLRRETSNLIEATENLQRAAHMSVNDGITKKIAETVTMKVKMTIIFTGSLVPVYFVVVYGLC